MDSFAYVHVGCGFVAPDEWENFDVSPTLRLERIPLLGRLIGRFSGNAESFPANVRHGDIRRELLSPEGKAAAIYCSHVLEHLARSEAEQALANCYRMLRPGACLRVVIPDLEARIRRYVEERDMGRPDAAHRFMSRSGLGLGSRSAGMIGTLRAAFGNSRHQWMWDEASLREALVSAGFVNIRRVQFGDWSDQMFALVERADRLVDDGMAELAFEATKPDSE